MSCFGLTSTKYLLGRLLVVALAAARLQAGVLTFEDLPDAYLFSGGGQNIGTLYSGITFGPNVTGLSVTRFGGYGSDAFPPHSGDVAIWDATDSTITISFASATPSFGVWYSSFDPITLQAFDTSNNLLGTVVGLPNTDGTIGTSSFLSFSNPSLNSVTLTSSPGLFTLDDVTTVVPEPSTFFLLGWAGLVFGCFRGFRGGWAGAFFRSTELKRRRP